MKTRLIHKALATAAILMISACDDQPTTPTTTEHGTEESAQTAQVTAEDNIAPGAEDISKAIAPMLAPYTWLEIPHVSSELTTTESGIQSLSAQIQLSVKEDMYRRESPPSAFNEERKAINASANAAVQPNSLYLLQIGAPTESITEEDRKSRPLPDNLKQLTNELRDLAESEVYTLETQAGTQYTITATMRATKGENGWDITDVSLQTANLPAPDCAVPAAAIPEGSAILTPEFTEARKQEIKTKIAAFEEAAAPYIKSREDEARAAWMEYKAATEEKNRKAAEEATAAAAEKEQWINYCTTTIAAGKLFSGEWVRGNDFGEVTLEISKARKYENSIQFLGHLYDTQLQEARMDIYGRCDFTKNEDGTSRVDITIYDGIYEEDKPTAEVYDASDGIMQLTLDAKGNLSGTMTCVSWKNNPEKAFRISLSQKNK